MDNGNAISIEIKTSPIQTDLELKTNNRFILGSWSAKYMTDTDLTLTIFYKQDNNMNWQSISPITLSRNKKRDFGQLPQGLSVIDYYVDISGSPNYIFELTSLKIHQKILSTGKFG